MIFKTAIVRVTDLRRIWLEQTGPVELEIWFGRRFGRLLERELADPARTCPEAVLATSPPRAFCDVEVEREFYRLRESGDDNPFGWKFDLCNLSMTNLEYRRVFLLRAFR